MDASSPAAAQIHDRVRSSVGGQRTGDSSHPAVPERGGPHALGDRITKNNPEREVARERGIGNAMPLLFERVYLVGHRPRARTDATNRAGNRPRRPRVAVAQRSNHRVERGFRGSGLSLRHVILVDVESVSMSRPNRPLFGDVSVTVSAGDRLGVVGINGTGKSTLLSVIAGTRDAEGGTVRRGRNVSIAVVDQVTSLPEGTVREAVGGGWRGEAALDRLGVGDLMDRSTLELSGGQEKRVALAQAVVADADLLVLDEPTNHLDVDAIEWLESELFSFRGGLVLVTHDRKVLDSLTTRILELDRGSSYLHDGGYAGYLEGRAAREERNAASESTRKNLARRELAWLRTGAKARSRKSKSRIGRANELIAGGPQAAAREGDLDLAQLHKGTPRLGDQVVELHDITIGFPGEPPLVEGLELLLDRRERLGIVGANGSGKSTLLDVIAGRRAPISGEVIVGPTAVVGLHDQRGRDLPPKSRVRDLMAGEGNEPDWWDVALLERFWFDSDTQASPIELLSGGERRRIQLVLTLGDKPNVLLLDEPTNDLDLDTLRALEDFLDHWPGAVVVVSHDRTFLDRTVDDVLVIDNGTAQRWPGGYEQWLLDRKTHGTKGSVASASTPAAAKPARNRASATGGRSHSTIRHELKTAEKEMTKLEKRRARLDIDLQEAGTDHVKLAEVGEAIAVCDQGIAATEERWLEISEELENR
ncbi:MAG: ATP-binding cassette subfamily F protein uup [Candidatus Aldehydirespiratoraceae bacterium]|jgi:ATP-binding cassette subfamily F protein uup